MIHRPYSRRPPTLLLALLLAAAGSHSSELLAQSPGVSPAARSVWDGVYTDVQSDRASGVFTQSCAGCHTLSATGRSPLSGPEFWESFSQATVADLLTYVRNNMPNGRGGSLPAASYNDVVALMLRANGFPAGGVELTPESSAAVRIVPKDGSSVLPANALARVVGCLTRRGDEWVLTQATAPERISRSGPGADDASRPLGQRTIALKYLITRVDGLADQRVSASGMLIGAGGVDGLNVTTVDSVAAQCP